MDVPEVPPEIRDLLDELGIDKLTDDAVHHVEKEEKRIKLARKQAALRNSGFSPPRDTMPEERRREREADFAEVCDREFYHPSMDDGKRAKSELALLYEVPFDVIYAAIEQAVAARQDPPDGESCDVEPKQRKSGVIVPFKRETPLPDPDISERARLAVENLRGVFKDAAGDAQLIESLCRDLRAVLEVHGLPSGASPPEPAQPALELPTSPSAWWRDRQPGETPDNWLRTHYKQYIDARLLTRGFFQRKGQDKAFYNALLQWEADDHTLPDDLYLPTKSELLDLQLEQMGGVVPKTRQVYASTPETRQAARQAARFYQATRRSLG